MRALQETELERMQATQVSAMMDTCIMLPVDESSSPDGQVVKSYPDPDSPYLEEVACGLEMQAGNELMRATMTVVKWDAVLRLPLGTVLGTRDRVAITARLGEVLDEPLLYDVAAPLQVGPSGVRVLLRKTQT